MHGTLLAINSSFTSIVQTQSASDQTTHDSIAQAVAFHVHIISEISMASRKYHIQPIQS